MKVAGFMPELTKLHAINRVLDAMGQAGITTLNEIDYHVDAGDINRVLDDISATIQTNKGKGYWFNQESFHKLYPAPDTGRVTLPNNCLAVRLKRTHQLREVKLAVRGNHLMDMLEYGFDLTALADPVLKYIPLDIIAFVDYDDLPQTAKDAIVDSARFWYVHDKDVDQAKFASLQQQAQRSFIALEQEDATHRKRNYFQNPNLRHPIASIGGFMNNN
ncbi:tail tubular protein A [Pseudomonas phage Alpheus]|uniref:Tail tubular protein A n=1 Tax=Pseudomonas phage Alpheus TaxID=2163983 RepID=A0A2S1GMZ0_9CAUD|nr:tail tubular protein A [Pseudomonas phage Alpheus]AWD90757.1 tail tubular protein A [Pseudomonas phage Alpheus]